MLINANGYWQSEDAKYHHYNDDSLIQNIIMFFKKENAKSIVDLGCGTGYYVTQMRKEGLKADGFDGNPFTPEITGNVCGVFDLSSVKQLEPYDWVLSLEVGEHLPQKFEDSFIQNIHINNKKGIILSWAIKGQGGLGHFNEQNNDHVKEKICKLGYSNDIESENILRKKCDLYWFQDTVMVFRKK